MPPQRRPARRPTAAANPRLRPDQARPAPLVLVTGAEDVLAERAVAAVVAAAREGDADVAVERLDAGECAPGAFALAVSPSLFGGAIVVVATGVERAGEAFVSEATTYLAAPAEEVCVVLRHSGGQRAKALLDAARAAGAPEVECAPITREEDKLDFAAGEFRARRVGVTPGALRALVDAVGSDLRELAAACRQLAADADGEVDAELVERYFGGRVEVTAFRVADAAAAGRAEQALTLLRHALATGADPVPMVAALALKVRGMAKVSAAGRGRSAELAKDLGMAPWQIDRARRDLQGWNDDGLARAVWAVADADTAVKGGGRDPVYAVEHAVLQIASARQG